MKSRESGQSSAPAGSLKQPLPARIGAPHTPTRPHANSASQPRSCYAPMPSRSLPKAHLWPYAPRPVRTPRCAPDHPVRAAFRPLLRYPAVRRRQTKQSFVCQEDRSAASGRSRQIKRPNRTEYAVPYRILPFSSVFGEIEKQIATYPSLFRNRGKRGLGIQAVSRFIIPFT